MDDPALLARRWRNRRWMAWAALIAGLLYPAMLLVTDSAQLGHIAMPFYIFVGGIVGAYVGFATADEKWQRDRGHGGHRHD